MTKKSGIELIAAERQEQIEKHGFTVEIDIENNPYKHHSNLVMAATGTISGLLEEFPAAWPDEVCNKILAKPTIERLAIAGALIAAEIDRLQAMENSNVKLRQ